MNLAKYKCLLMKDFSFSQYKLPEVRVRRNFRLPGGSLCVTFEAGSEAVAVSRVRDSTLANVKQQNLKFGFSVSLAHVGCSVATSGWCQI